MKQLLTIILLLCAAQSYSQQHCRMINSEASVEYLKTGSAATAARTVTVTVEYYSDAGAVAANMPLVFNITPPPGIYAPAITAPLPSYTLLAADFKTKHQTKDITLDLTITALPAYKDGNFTITMTAAGAPVSGSTVVRITEKDESIAAKTKYDGLKPFWIELGTNLDLIDGPKPSNFTAGIFYHKFDHRWGKRGRQRWASFAGAYEAKIVSSESNPGFVVDSFISSKSFVAGNPNSIATFTYAGIPKQTQTVRNWSFFYSPAYRWGKGEHDDGNFHLYTSLWFELRYQEVQTITDYSSLVLLNTHNAPLNTMGSYRNLDDTLVKSSAYTHYFGVGFPICTETRGDKGFSLLLNPVIGATNQLTRAGYDSLATSKTGLERTKCWHPFYFVQFRLSDKEFGITVTGEIRGLLVRNSPPQYTIALTKKFNLKKLLVYNGNE